MKSDKTVKNVLPVIAAFVCAVLVIVLISCGGKEEGSTLAPTETKKEEALSVFAMNGPTGVSLVGMAGSDKYEFTFADSAEEALPDLIKGKYDIVSIPSNLAAVLNVKASGTYKIAAVNTLGVLYMLDSSGDIKSVSDLKGKKILATGEGLIPGFVLEYVLTKNGLTPGEDVEIEYYSAPADIGSLLLSEKESIAMLPEPYVTTLLQKSDGKIAVALDMTEEFDKVSGDGTRLFTSCVAVNKKSLDEGKISLAEIISDIEKSVDFVKSNTSDAAKKVAELGIIPSEAIALKAIPMCKTVALTGDEMKEQMLGLYGELYAFKPSLCGGVLPDETIFA